MTPHQVRAAAVLIRRQHPEIVTPTLHACLRRAAATPRMFASAVPAAIAPLERLALGEFTTAPELERAWRAAPVAIHADPYPTRRKARRTEARTALVQFCVTARELERLRRRASAKHLTVAEYVRRLVLD